MMKIPAGVDQKEFYKQACEKGIKIISRYTGVSIKKMTRSAQWQARYDGKLIGIFPLTQEGELKAYEAYQDYLKENNIEQRYVNTPRQNKKNETK